MWEELEGKEQWDRKVVIDINLKKVSGLRLARQKRKYNAEILHLQ